MKRVYIIQGLVWPFLCDSISKSIRCPVTIRNLISSRLKISFNAAILLVMDKVTSWESLSIMTLAIFILMATLIASWMARVYESKSGSFLLVYGELKNSPAIISTHGTNDVDLIDPNAMHPCSTRAILKEEESIDLWHD